MLIWIEWWLVVPFALCVVVRLWFLLAGLLPLLRHKPLPAPETLPSLTVLVCAHNEEKNLPTLLPLLVSQDYPGLQILIVDDRSSDATPALLTDWAARHQNVQFLRIDETPDGWSPKKYAMQQGMAVVTTEWTLFTDADCAPASDQWAQLMAASMHQDAVAVLGDAPLKTGGGWLGWLQRWENRLTMLHGLGLAKAGLPYLAIGRNWALRTKLFHKAGGSASHRGFLSGDDDLTLQKLAVFGRVEICTDPRSQVMSEAPNGFLLWNRQKKRHIGAGVAYRPAALLRLAMLHSANLLPLPLVLVGMGVSSLWAIGLCILAGLWLGEVLAIGEITRKRERRFAWSYPPFAQIHPLMVAGWALTSKRKTTSNWS